MSLFQYRARNREGQVVSGQIEADSSAAAAALVIRNGSIPVHISEVVAASEDARAWLRQLVVHEGHLPVEQLISFCRQAHTLLRAGVPITRALAALQESNTHRGFGRILQDLREKLESGRELSVAMEDHGTTFDEYFRSMVRIGEATGRIDEIFLRLCDHLEFGKEMNQQVKSATRYPAFVVGAILLAMVAINLFVIPSFAAVFHSMHTELPLITRFLVGCSDFTIHQWPWLLVILMLVTAALRAWLATPAGRLSFHAVLLRLPIIGSLLLKAGLARFARSLSLALRSGLPMIEALDIATHTITNEFMKLRLSGMRPAIVRGEPVTAAARNCHVFTPVVLQMLAIGDESGTIDELLAKVADSYESDVRFELKGLSDAIEPLLILVLSVIVLVLALGVFLPMWDLGQVALKPQH